MPEDPANCVINTVANAMRLAFDPNSDLPPVGGGTTVVRLFAGAGLPIEAWNFYRGDDDGCPTEPFIWVRLMRRYRSKNFPSPYTGGDPCSVPLVVPVEVGVARCTLDSGGPCDWDCYEDEAEISIDDSWRVERALCWAATQLRRTPQGGGHPCAVQVGHDLIVPYGPDDGVLAWIGSLYVQLS